MKKSNLILIIAAATVAAIYLGGVIYFSFHFCPGSTLNGQDISWMTIGKVQELVNSKASDYVLNITGRNNLSEEVTAAEISWTPQFDEGLSDNLGFLNGLKWPVSIFFHKSYTNAELASFDEELLKKRIESMSFFEEENVIAPTDAQLEFDDESAEYVIISEDNGSEIDKSAFYDAVCEALCTMQTSLILDDADVYKTPSIYSDDETLVKECESLNKYASSKITYTFGDDVITVDGSYIKDWLIVDESGVSLDTDKIVDFVNSLGKTYDTFGRDRTFTTSLGNTIIVSGGDYGWWMDRNTTSKELIEAIESTSVCDMTPVYFGTAASYGERDYGDSYVEIDLDNQHVYVYEDGELIIDTDCVSGKVTKDRVTPTGTFGITYKERNATLVGENYSSDVKYWMPFYGNVGLHDASWRSTFGSNIYITSGSHGCVNLPSSAAEVVFEHVEKGEAVIVYGGVQPDELKDYLKNQDSSKEQTDDTNQESDNVMQSTENNDAASSENSADEENDDNTSAEEGEM